MTTIQYIVTKILKKLAQLTILRYRPAIVAVTGSVGKTSTKIAIAAVLGTERRVRATRGNFNGEIGVPLTILGDWRKEDLRLFSRDLPPGAHRFRKAWFLIKVAATSLFHLAVPTAYPEVLVLEYGIDRPGDMKNLIGIARPNVAVMTAMGETPAHVEYFENPLAVAREKARLIEAVPSTGFAILNADDPMIMGLRPRTRAQGITYGFAKDASVGIMGFEHWVLGGEPKGVAFTLTHGGAHVPAKLEGVLGRSNAYVAAAAAAAGLAFGMNLVSIAEALEAWYRPAAHRMELLPGAHGSWIIDDTYNAGPLSMRAALETLIDLPAKRRIAVLGDMLEIGEHAAEEHEKIGRLLASHIDILVAIGSRALGIAEGAKKGGMKKGIEHFETEEDARAFVKETLKKGDLVLVKASRAMHLDRLVAEVEEVRAE